MPMPALGDMHFRRETFIKDLARWGYPQLAERATRELPEEFDGVEADAWAQRVGISWDDVRSRMGGSP